VASAADTRTPARVQWCGIALGFGVGLGGGIDVFGDAVFGSWLLPGEFIVPVLVPGWFGPGVIAGSVAFEGRSGAGVGVVGAGWLIVLGVVLALPASWLQAVAPAATTSENKSDLVQDMMISDTD
jgi:hypothetical protein